MKKLKHILSIIIAVFFLAACEKNDPLNDQGLFTGNLAPFNLLAQMPDAKVEDTLMLRTVAWATNDDINNISFFYKGFKIKDYSVKMQITVNNEPVLFEAAYKTDTLEIESTLIKSYPEEGESLNLHYQTAENAYVVVCPFVVATGFNLLVEEGAPLIMAMPDEDYAVILEMISLQMKRPDVLHLWPGAPFACFEFDPNTGLFTGNLTEFGINYAQENLTREILVENLVEATVDDNTRGTIESVATVAVTNTSKTSSRNFRIIE